MPNIEMKAPFKDLAKARQKAKDLGGKFLWKDEQIDTYFQTKKGKLKLRQSRLNGSELLPYLKTEDGGLKRSDYVRLPTLEPQLLAVILDQLLGTKTVVRKIREVFLIDNVRVHLDEVDGLGNFLEFEAVFEEDSPRVQMAEHRKVVELMGHFGVTKSDLIQGSYPEMIGPKKSHALEA